MILFLSGPISGIPDAPTLFNAAAQSLKDAGFEDIVTPVNNRPQWVHDGEDLWTQYMRASLRQMLRCEALALLPGWQYSRGSQVEQALARELGMPIRTVNEWIFGEVFNARD